MVLNIARRQLLEYFQSARFVAAAVLCLAIGTAVTAVRTASYERSLKDYRLIRADDREEAAGYVQPGALTYSGVSITRPPSVMAIFYAGLEPERPASVRVTANRDPVVESQYERTNPVSRFFQTMDFVAVVALIISVLAIALGHDIISGEKERGTLRLALSFPVPRSAIILGKWLGGLAALGVPLILTALCSLLVVVLSPEAQLDAGDVYAFAALTTAALLFVGVIYSLTLFVSCLTARSFTTITALIALWVALTVGVPGIGPYLARFVVPVATPHEVEGDKWTIIDEENRLRNSKIVEYQKNPDESSVDQMVFYSEVFRESFLSIANRQEQIHAEFERTLQRQVQAAAWISRLSPIASFVYAAGNLADTGIRDWSAFRRAVQRYRIAFLNYAEDKWIQRERDGTGSITTADYPRFTYKKPGSGDRLAASIPDLGLLGAWTVIFFAAATVAFLRYDPR